MKRTFSPSNHISQDVSVEEMLYDSCILYVYFLVVTFCWMWLKLGREGSLHFSTTSELQPEGCSNTDHHGFCDLDQGGWKTFQKAWYLPYFWNTSVMYCAYYYGVLFLIQHFSLKYTLACTEHNFYQSSFKETGINATSYFLFFFVVEPDTQA